MGKIMIECTCPFCGATHYVKVDEDDWLSYCNGALAQNAFPELNVTEREQIISGICPECQESIFGEEPD